MIKVYDSSGNWRDLPWLHSVYGDFEIEEGAEFKVTALRERYDDLTMVVTVKDADGKPMQGVRVAWYWPEAPVDFMAGGLGRCEFVETKEDGTAGFPMGGGAYYRPWDGQVGPHAVWVYGADSDIVKGLGMLWGTNHFHFNVEFTFKPGTLEPPAPPPVEPPPVDGVAYIRELLAQAVALIKEADARLAKWQS